MTVFELAKLSIMKSVVLPDPGREINGVYMGDLLSWVMGRAFEDQAWITIMSNTNVIAVASLVNVSCIILTEGVQLPDELQKLAEDKDINVLSFEGTSYEAAVEMYKVLS